MTERSDVRSPAVRGPGDRAAPTGPAGTADRLDPRDRTVITVLLVSAFVVILNETIMSVALPVLMVDPILIEQVVLNLLKNAAEAIDNAKLPPARRNIELRVVPRHTPDEGEVIEFSVTDMGPGLAPEVIARMYEAFFSTKVEGLGIGLSLCRSIIESHRGRIKAQNLYNGDTAVGCRFSFTLPVQSSSAEPFSISKATVTS